jgi:hypothetical protein
MHGLRRLRGALSGDGDQPGLRKSGGARGLRVAAYLMLPVKRFSTSAGASTCGT